MMEIDVPEWFGKTIVGWILGVIAAFLVFVLIAAGSLVYAHEGNGLHLHNFEWSDVVNGGIHMRGEAHQGYPCKSFSNVSLLLEISHRDTGHVYGTTRTPEMDGFFHFGDTALVNHYAPDIDVVPETPLRVTYTFLGKAHDGACV